MYSGRHGRRWAALIAVTTGMALAAAFPGVAAAHPDHGSEQAQQELFPGEGVEFDKQHEGDEGHLPPQ